jgi:hypothetical protein
MKIFKITMNFEKEPKCSQEVAYQKRFFFAYFVFRGSIGIYQSDQTSRIVKKIHKSMHHSAHSLSGVQNNYKSAIDRVLVRLLFVDKV